MSKRNKRKSRKMNANKKPGGKVNLLLNPLLPDRRRNSACSRCQRRAESVCYRLISLSNGSVNSKLRFVELLALVLEIRIIAVYLRRFMF